MPALGGSQVAAAVTAQDLVVVGDEALPHQRGAAARAVEAVVVPVTVLEGDVFATTKTCGRDRGQGQRLWGNWDELPEQTDHLQVRSSHTALVVAHKTQPTIK